MESKPSREWMLAQAAITSILILGTWVLVAGSWAVFGQVDDLLEFPEILDQLIAVFGFGLMFLIPFFWSYRLIRKTAAHVSGENTPDQTS